MDLSQQNSRILGSNRRSWLEWEKCKERRRRRIQMRQNGAVFRRRQQVVSSVPAPESGSAAEEAPQNSGGGYSWMFKNNGGEASSSGSYVVDEANNNDVVRTIGAVAVAGRQRAMEDAVAVHANLCSPPFNLFRPVHFFGVFDGHGGNHVSTICKKTMHEILEEELMRARYPITWSAAAFEFEFQQEWRNAFKRCFSRTENLALNTCSSCRTVGFNCTCNDQSVVFRSGSTAVVVVLTQEHVVVANCGDSRAVLYRGGRVVPLSFDHKPDREDEKARIEALGGRIYSLDVARVEGVLAISRAIGDKYLKPTVTSEPELTFTRRSAEDEFIILASDGIWDVISNEMTCHVARECMRESLQTTPAGVGSGALINSKNDAASVVSPSHSESAASLLARLALARGTYDNISLVVVDLKKAI